MRAHLYGRAERARTLIDAHWSLWLGSIVPADSLLRWESGFVVEAAFKKLPAQWQLSSFLELPTLQFLRRLAFGPSARASLVGLERARALEELVFFGESLTNVRLPQVERLTLDLQGSDPERLRTVALPALRALHTRCAAKDETTLMRVAAAASWWPSLKTWTHRVQSAEGLRALLSCGPVVERQGRGLVALCEQAVLQQVTPELRRSLPLAEFKLMPVPERPSDPEDSHGPAEVAVAPGGTGFRELPGWVEKSSRGTQNSGGTDAEAHGPGERFEHRSYEFGLCGWCGGEDTRRIFKNYWSMYSHFETTHFQRWEYECMECGLFTAMRSTRTS
ncbi:MAG: hypothetical protein Q8S42_02680 [Archangium sp.]|nr:hypothetical protein [Archangium sp.]